jgi:hypothetical protein
MRKLPQQTPKVAEESERLARSPHRGMLERQFIDAAEASVC